MSNLVKADLFDAALILLLECKDYILKSYSNTPGRNALLNKIGAFEAKITARFGQGE